jgi:hypothetical protein
MRQKKRPVSITGPFFGHGDLQAASLQHLTTLFVAFGVLAVLLSVLVTLCIIPGAAVIA